MKIIRIIDKVVEVLAVSAFASSTLFILINVVNRYLVSGLMRSISKSQEWFVPTYHFFREHMGSVSVMADEVPGYLLVWIAFLGAYLALRAEGHISFDMLVDKLSGKPKKFVEWLNVLLIAGFLCLLFVQSIRMIRVSGRTEIETADIAQGWFMAILPIASVILLIALAHKTFSTVNTNSNQS